MGVGRRGPVRDGRPGPVQRGLRGSAGGGLHPAAGEQHLAGARPGPRPARGCLSVRRAGRAARPEVRIPPHRSGDARPGPGGRWHPARGGRERRVRRFLPPSGELAVVVVRGTVRAFEFPAGRVLFQTDGWISDARFSRGGEQIAFVHHPLTADTMGEVVLVDLSGKARTLTVRYPVLQGLVWAPDDAEIWFTSGELQRNLLRAVDLQGRAREVYRAPSESLPGGHRHGRGGPPFQRIRALRGPGPGRGGASRTPLVDGVGELRCRGLSRS